VFATVDQVKRFASLPRPERRAFFDRYERSLADGSAPAPKDPDYRLFGLTESATVEQVHERYRELALAFHPDRQGDVETMQQINAAYRRLVARSRERSDPRA
jgi:DnaJ-class molecular chaperone